MNLRNYFRSFKFGDDKQLHELQVSQQQISYMLAALCMFLFFIFMAGYYWGKKSALEHFTEQLESDSLADKVSYAFSSLYDANDEAEEDDQPEETDDDGQVLTAAAVESDGEVGAAVAPETKVDLGSKSSGNSDLVASVQSNKSGAQIVESLKQKPSHEHFAQLAGFGASRTARSYTQILTKKGYDVKIVERKSRTARGKQTSWYQVITRSYTDKDELLKVIEKIKKVSPIGDVKIVSVDRGLKQ